MSGGNLCIWNSLEGQRDEAGTMVEERSNKRNGMVACEREGDGEFEAPAPHIFHRRHSFLLSCAG